MNIQKYASLAGQEISDEDLRLINQQTLRPLRADEVFSFRVLACDSAIDRDHECFSRAALDSLAKLFVGKPVIGDHKWSSDKQAARIYDAELMESAAQAQLLLRCYMLRTEKTQEAIAAIEGGILREVSVGCQCTMALCSICGTDRRETYCGHTPGHDYDTKLCYITLDNATDAYELSFVAVPAQPGAGVIKHYGGTGEPQDYALENDEDESLALARAWQELETKRYGGMTNESDCIIRT